MKKGDRVRHEFLGDGTFIEKVSFMSLVKWDKTPPIQYNMGGNPCVVFTRELRKIKKLNKNYD